MFTIRYLIYFSIQIYSALLSQTNNSRYNGHYVPRVVNGYPAKLGDVPYQVSFKTASRTKYTYASFCGGTILTPNKLLSAAHCFVRKPGFCQKLIGTTGVVRSLSEKYAVAGDLQNQGVRNYRDLDNGGQWRKLKKVYFPWNYKFPKRDIAVVYIKSPFVFNSYVNSIPIASRMIDYKGKCLVSGFGRISHYNTSDKLLLANLELLSLAQCDMMHRRLMKRFVCTSSALSDVGKGDSGGPLVCTGTGDPKEQSGKGILVGVVSGHRYGSGSFFTRVSSYYKYVERGKSNVLYSKINIVIIIETIILLF